MLKTTFLLLIFFCFSAAKSQQTTTADSTLLVFASDTQKPMWIETLWLKSNHNKEATEKIFGEVAQRRPKALFLLGDVVNLGYSNRQWKAMGGYLKNLRSKGVTVCAALGNHEVMGRAKKGEEKFQTFFPDHVRTGFVKVVDSVAVVLLNSNFGKMGPADDAIQLNWYQQTLHHLDADSSIHFIITGCHHSPFTNSKIVGCSKEVEQKFVEPFLRSQKSQLFLSGHSHNFEHFKKSGKDFLVIGGGGGLHQPLKKDQSLHDLATEYKPAFHYLTVKRTTGQLEVKSFQLKDDFSAFEEGKLLVIKKQQDQIPVTASNAAN